MFCFSVHMKPRRTIIHVAYGLGGTGAVANRALADIRAGMRNGHRVIGVTDKLAADLGSDLPVRTGGREAFVGALPAPGGELGSMAIIWVQLRRLVREVSPDLIVFHSSTLAWPVIPIAKRAGARSVFVVQALIRDRLVHGANPYGPVTTRLYQASNRYALRESWRVVCVSEHMAEMARLAGAAPANVRTVPNPVELGRFAAEINAGSDRRDIDVLFVGRLSTEKGVDVLIEAVRSMGITGRIVIAGDGPLRSELEAAAAMSGVPIEFLGWVAADALPGLLRRAHIQVVPSRSEPQGVVVLEALASGTPVIGSRVGGIPEMIEDGGNGWLVDSNDPGALRRAITIALADREHVNSMRGPARRSVDRFDLDRLPMALDTAYLDGL
jgi:glycosyltransferase involved in cell wall biosynthesis